MTVHFVCVRKRGGKSLYPSKIANVGTKCCIFINPSATTALEGRNLTISNLFTVTALPPDVQSHNTQ